MSKTTSVCKKHLRIDNKAHREANKIYIQKEKEWESRKDAPKKRKIGETSKGQQKIEECFTTKYNPKSER
jgi:hypothetical protein